jgi:hypothetical protein
MKYFFIVLSLVFLNTMFGQITCETLCKTGVAYTGNTIKSGRTKLYNADTSITNKIKHQSFELKKVSELSPEESNELKHYKFNLNPADTVIFYDWDIMHQSKMGYYGKAVGKVNINCRDSVIRIRKYLLNKETKDEVPTRFKIYKLHDKDFIFYDIDHPYLNINYYFKRKE